VHRVFVRLIAWTTTALCDAACASPGSENRQVNGVKTNCRVTVLTMLASAALVAGFAGLAQAQSNKVMRLIVPFGAGGAQEILARSFHNELGAALGQNIIIENRPGAGGAIGSAVLAKATPDGQTLLMGATSHLIGALVAEKAPYDPIRDFTAVAHVGLAGGLALLVNAKFPAQTVAEFVKYVKANPGKVDYGSAGTGSSTHLAMATFANAAGLQMVHVPYKSNAEPIIELIGGRIHTSCIPMAIAPGYAKEERLRMLAVTSAKRSPLLSGLPTLAESFPGYSYQGWYGVLGPAGMPRRVVERLNTEINRLLKEPAILDRIGRLSIDALPITPQEFEKMMREDYARLAGVLKKSGVGAN
jgi:tripartite-type tricarboxylate transporter receptor subunit TctC